MDRAKARELGMVISTRLISSNGLSTWCHLSADLQVSRRGKR